jgi:8-oxo-dGTP diphosphatase
MNEEYFDILDENGNKTGQIKPRSEVHRDGLVHRMVHVWIVNSQNKILMQRRAPQKDSYPNMWDVSVGGHILAGMDAIETVIKEVEEELGVNIELNEIELLFKFKGSDTYNETVFNNGFYEEYLIEKDLDIKTLKIQKEEVAEVRWFSMEELEKEILNKNPEFVPHTRTFPILFKILRERFKK